MHYLTAAAAFATAAVAAPWGWGPPSHHGPPSFGPPGFFKKPTAYFVDESPAGASVVALSIGKNGKLSDPVRTATGGKGLIAVSPAGASNPVDPLAAQNSLIVEGNLLFAVNSGSNTLSLFVINPFDPEHPILVGEPVSTKGEFPVSVAYSEELNKACVLNGGAVNGVACFEVNPFKGLTPVGGLRPLGQALNQTTPPSSPALTASDILFTPDLSAVIAITKGNAMASPVAPGWIVAYSIDGGVISETPVYTCLDTLPMPFGSQFLADGTLFASDPSVGGGFLTIGDDLKATVDTIIKVEGQKAICWTAYDPELTTAYLPDAGANLLNKVNSETGALEGAIEVTTSNVTAVGPGLFDTIVYDNYAISLAGEPGLVVVDLIKGKQIQYLDLNSFGSRQGWTGMALYA